MQTSVTAGSGAVVLWGLMTLGGGALLEAPSPFSDTPRPVHAPPLQLAAVETDLSDLAPGGLEPPAEPAAGPCLKTPVHLTQIPQLAPGVQVALRRYLRFPDAAGRTVHARMLLLEVNHRRMPTAGLPAEFVARRHAIPQRLIAIGHEVDPGDKNAFEADFDIPPESVSRLSPCRYEVDLGSVKCIVQTVQ